MYSDTLSVGKKSLTKSGNGIFRKKIRTSDMFPLEHKMSL